MRLKRLELFGFKSFADRTVLDFGDNQLTGVVGPNGCGKSNVVDAVRWVLGETRPSSMRGAGMTDVIFKGSASRPPMSVAEATMVIGNEEGILEEHGPEVSITRRLYKSGEGEYLIDGEKVRLKDLRDLLFNTGLGSRGYSVLEQGRIDAVLSANPVQRRSIFEEAAGVSRYRQRRHEAELRLKRVVQDVTRLEDVMGELRTRVRSLKIQAGKAERFLAARAEWTAERERFFRHRLFAIDAELAELVPELERLEAELDELRQLRTECEEEVTLRERERSSIVAELDRVSSEVGRIAGELLAMDERKSQLGLRVSSWRASAAEESERARALRESLEARTTELAEMRANGEELTRAVQVAQSKLDGLAGRARELDKAYRDVRRAVGEQNEIVLGKLHEKTAAQNSVRHLEASREPTAERRARIVERSAVSDAVIGEVRAEAEDARRLVQESEEEVVERSALLNERRANLAALDGELEQVRREEKERELERAALVARIESLRDPEAERRTLADGTRAVLEAIEAGEGPCGSDALAGILADHLDIELRFARALDVALSERSQMLVARDTAVVRDVLGWLAREQVGQAGLVVPEGLAPARDALNPFEEARRRAHLASLLDESSAVEGRLVDLLQCAPNLRPLTEALLGEVWIVRDLDNALALAAREPSLRFVTPLGESVDASGVIGGHRELTQGPVGRRSSALELEERVALGDAELQRLAEQMQVLRGRRAELEREVQVGEEARDLARRELGEREGALSTASARLTDQEAARTELAAEERRAVEEIEELERSLIAAREECVRSEADFVTENERLEEMETGRRSLEEERESLAREESRAQVDATRSRGELTALERRIEDVDRRNQEDTAEVQRAEGRATNYLANAEQGEQEGADLADKASVVAEERGQLEVRLAELRESEKSGAERIAEVRGRAEEVQAALDASGERLSDQKLAEQRAELSRDELVGRAQEDLSLGADELRAEFEPEDELASVDAMSALERRVAELRAQLDKIGPVNTEAVSELDEVSERLTFLETQSSDLADARRRLSETIEKIDEESRRLFVETFDEVRANFQGIFRKLFGGGRADIQLEEGVDVLEAGIEIVARPPGREMLSIGLLSGGQRTMTALALLFAVFEARPSPFCVLDEVDAALDDANIDRFLGMLEGFVETSQFIVVTHNKGTMSACDALFGVTMQVRGVSRFVAVELDDVDEIAPETTGTMRSAKSSDSGAPADDPADDPADGAASGDAPPAGEAQSTDVESGERVVEIVPASGEPAQKA